MQGELTGAPGVREIRILGLNGIGEEAGNSTIVAGRTIPWLQDISAQQVWVDWKVTYRDVIVLDAENNVAGIYNLTEHNLGVQANYDALKALLLTTAAQ